MSVLKAHWRGISLSRSVATMEKTYAFDSGLSTVMRSKLECFKSIAFMRCYTQLALIFFFLLLKFWKDKTQLLSRKKTHLIILSLLSLLFERNHSTYKINKYLHGWFAFAIFVIHLLWRIANKRVSGAHSSLNQLWSHIYPYLIHVLLQAHSCFQHCYCAPQNNTK